MLTELISGRGPRPGQAPAAARPASGHRPLPALPGPRAGTVLRPSSARPRPPHSPMGPVRLPPHTGGEAEARGGFSRLPTSVPLIQGSKPRRFELGSFAVAGTADNCRGPSLCAQRSV